MKQFGEKVRSTKTSLDPLRKVNKVRFPVTGRVSGLVFGVPSARATGIFGVKQKHQQQRKETVVVCDTCLHPCHTVWSWEKSARCVQRGFVFFYLYAKHFITL